MNKNFGEMIRALRKSRGWNQTQLAEAIGVTQPSVSRWEDGGEIELEHRMELAQLDKSRPPREWVGFDWPHEKPFGDEAWVIGAVQAGNWVEAIEWPPEERFRLDFPEIRAYRQFTSKKAFKVEGPSMNRRFPPGSFLIVVPFIALDRDPKHGEYVICQRRRKDGLWEATCKQFRVVDGEKYLWPESDHPDHQTPLGTAETPDIEEMQVTGLVIGAFVVM